MISYEQSPDFDTAQAKGYRLHHLLRCGCGPRGKAGAQDLVARDALSERALDRIWLDLSTDFPSHGDDVVGAAGIGRLQCEKTGLRGAQRDFAQNDFGVGLAHGYPPQRH